MKIVSSSISKHQNTDIIIARSYLRWGTGKTFHLYVIVAYQKKHKGCFYRVSSIYFTSDLMKTILLR